MTVCHYVAKMNILITSDLGTPFLSIFQKEMCAQMCYKYVKNDKNLSYEFQNQTKLKD